MASLSLRPTSRSWSYFRASGNPPTSWQLPSSMGTNLGCGNPRWTPAPPAPASGQQTLLKQQQWLKHSPGAMKQGKAAPKMASKAGAAHRRQSDATLVRFGWKETEGDARPPAASPRAHVLVSRTNGLDPAGAAAGATLTGWSGSGATAIAKTVSLPAAVPTPPPGLHAPAPQPRHTTSWGVRAAMQARHSAPLPAARQLPKTGGNGSTCSKVWMAGRGGVVPGSSGPGKPGTAAASSQPIAANQLPPACLQGSSSPCLRAGLLPATPAVPQQASPPRLKVVGGSPTRTLREVQHSGSMPAKLQPSNPASSIQQRTPAVDPACSSAGQASWQKAEPMQQRQVAGGSSASGALGRAAVAGAARSPRPPRHEVLLAAASRAAECVGTEAPGQASKAQATCSSGGVGPEGSSCPGPERLATQLSAANHLQAQTAAGRGLGQGSASRPDFGEAASPVTGGGASWEGPAPCDMPFSPRASNTANGDERGGRDGAVASLGVQRGARGRDSFDSISGPEMSMPPSLSCDIHSQLAAQPPDKRIEPGPPSARPSTQEEPPPTREVPFSLPAAPSLPDASPADLDRPSSRQASATDVEFFTAAQTPAVVQEGAASSALSIPTECVQHRDPMDVLIAERTCSLSSSSLSSDGESNCSFGVGPRDTADTLPDGSPAGGDILGPLSNDVRVNGGDRLLAKEYIVVRVVGEGAYGQVMKCVRRSTGAVVALKEYKIEDDDNDAEKVKRTARRELRMLQNLRHHNIVSVLDHFFVWDRLFIVMGYVPHTVLELLDHHPRGLKRSTIRHILYQLCKAITFIHSKGVIYRDVKPENLLVDEEGNIKLCDFGFARYISDRAQMLTDYVATRWYRAPELLLGQPFTGSDGRMLWVKYGEPVDMWAVGCLMGELADGEPLFPGDSDADQLIRIQSMLGPIVLEHQQFFLRNPHNRVMELPGPQQGTLAARYRGKLDEVELDFMSRLLAMDPQKRLTGEQALRHAYFADLVSQAVADAKKRSTHTHSQQH